MKIISEEKPKEKIKYSSLKDGTLFKIGKEVFFVSSDAASKKKLMTCLNTGITYCFLLSYLYKKDIIENSTLIIER